MPACGLLAALALLSLASLASADDTIIEEVIVIGSYIKGSPIDAPSPVEVIDLAEIQARGNPDVRDIVQRLSAVVGAEGRTNPFVGEANQQGTSSVNLRGLGPQRTLVLLNGLRLASSADLYVNVNVIPSVALERVEILKDGASATYGSDAISGVTNFITRSDFRGIELEGAVRDVDATQETDWDAGVIAGLGTERLDLVASFGYQHWGRIPNRDKDWVLQPAQRNPAGGFSFSGNPVTLLPFNTFTPTQDPDCATVGGIADYSVFCQFRFTDFFALQEKEEHYQFFLEGNYELSDRLGLHLEALYAKDDVPDLWLSPSFPPLSVFDIDRVVVPGMPHFDDFVARNPTLADDLSSGALVVGRVLGVAGPEEVGSRESDAYRLSAGFTWDFSDRVSVRTEAVYTRSEIDNFSFDSRIDHLTWAYRGFAGPECDPVTGVPGSGHLGTGDCFYFNPFTSGFEFSRAAGFEGVPGPGSDDPTLLNPPWLMDWIKDPITLHVTTEMLVVDVIFDGDTPWTLPGGTVAFAAGSQYREDSHNREPGLLADSSRTPCAFDLDAAGETFLVPPTFLPQGGVIPPYLYTCNGAGPFHFVAGTGPVKDDQDVVAAFAELALPVTESVDLQIAVRYEDYGSSHGDTLDPKIAARWDATDALSLRASYSSSFRAPPVNFLGGVRTTYSFVPQELSFIPVEIVGNPDLQPEQADTYNVGIIWRPFQNTYASFDFWRFNLSDPIVQEPYQPIVDAALDPTHPGHEIAQDKVEFGPVDNIERVTLTYASGPDVETDGFDYQLTTDLASDLGLFTFGVRGTYIHRYEVDDWLWGEGFDAEGYLNTGRTAPPIPQWKSNAHVNWSRGPHNVRLDLWYTSDYDDRRSLGGGGPQTIDDYLTADLHYNLTFNDERTRIFASINNITDEDPPFARLDLSYDPYTHDPFGIIYKLGLQHRFEGGPFQ